VSIVFELFLTLCEKLEGLFVGILIGRTHLAEEELVLGGFAFEIAEALLFTFLDNFVIVKKTTNSRS
jgi:hypothetical protein